MSPRHLPRKTPALAVAMPDQPPQHRFQLAGAGAGAGAAEVVVAVLVHPTASCQQLPGVDRFFVSFW